MNNWQDAVVLWRFESKSAVYLIKILRCATKPCKHLRPPMKIVEFPRLVLALSLCFLLQSAPALEAQAQVDFSGTWQQDLSRSVPQRKSQRPRELKIQHIGRTLTVKITTQRGQDARTLDLKYKIGGQELVYIGLDGDEFHTQVRWDGESLVFDTVEHERGKEIVSKQIWTLSEGGKVLREVKQAREAGEQSESVAVFAKE
jgi:hypothetical protein